MVQLLAGIISLRRVLEANPGRLHGSADTLPLRHSANLCCVCVFVCAWRVGVGGGVGCVCVCVGGGGGGGGVAAIDIGMISEGGRE